MATETQLNPFNILLNEIIVLIIKALLITTIYGMLPNSLLVNIFLLFETMFPIDKNGQGGGGELPKIRQYVHAY